MEPHIDPEVKKRMDFLAQEMKFDGRIRSGDVQEYCVSEGWIDTRVRRPDGRFRTEDGRYVIVRKFGHVEVFMGARPRGINKAVPSAVVRQIVGPRTDSDVEAISAAEAKRRRKAEKRAALAAGGSV